MPKRKQQQAGAPADSGEEQEAAGAEPAASDSSSGDSSDDYPSGDEGSSGESSDDEAGEAFEQVDVDFEFYCPQEKDFLGLRTLLANYLDGKEWACSDLADAIIQQASEAGAQQIICGLPPRLSAPMGRGALHDMPTCMSALPPPPPLPPPADQAPAAAPCRAPLRGWAA